MLQGFASGWVRRPKLPQHGQRLGVTLGGAPIDADEAVEVDAERLAGRHRRILLAQEAGRGVARVGQQRLAGVPQLLVEPVEVLEAQEDLAAHLQPGGRIVAAQPVRHGADRADVGGDVLADVAVAAGGPADELAVLVGDRDRDAVDLRLADVGRSHGRAPSRTRSRQATSSSSSNTLSSDSRRAECLTGANRADGAPPTRWVGESGVSRSGCFSSSAAQLAQQPIEVGVGDLGRVEHVVAIAVVLDLRAQLVDAKLGRGHLGLLRVVHGPFRTTTARSVAGPSAEPAQLAPLADRRGHRPSQKRRNHVAD